MQSYVGCRMKKIGIVSNKTNRKDAGSFFLFVFLLPYVCACLWGHVGEETGTLGKKSGEEEQDVYIVEASVEWGVWELPVTEYLTYRLYLTMPKDYSQEARKAQAVLLRTELAAMYKEGADLKIAVDGEGLTGFYREKGQEREETFGPCRLAVEETAGEILTYHGEPIRASYFKVSNGHTRAAEEAGEKDCPYLASVSCGQDKDAPDCRSVVKVDRGVYIETLRRVLGGNYGEEEIWEGGDFSFDSAGYMTSVSYDTREGEEKKIDGETYRHLFGLASASFEMEREEERMVFHVTGVGHGFGMSQFAADCKAKDGEGYRQILQDFFLGAELVKFE